MIQQPYYKKLVLHIIISVTNIQDFLIEFSII